MTDINSYSLTGRVADEPRYSSTKNGTATLSFCLAVNRDRKNNDQWIQKASFFYLTLYGNRAAGLYKILSKGTKVGVQGYLEQDAWTDSSGKKQYKTVFCVENLVLLGQPKAPDTNEKTENTMPHKENSSQEENSQQIPHEQNLSEPQDNFNEFSADDIF